MNKFFCAIAFSFLSLAASAATTEMTHKDGSKTTVSSDKTGSRVDTTAKGSDKPSGSETNAGSHKENVDRVKQEGKDKHNPVTKEAKKP
jgi:hypothetical protein